MSANTTGGWSINLQATAAVRRHATSDADRRELLEMIGLLQPGGRVLSHDDVAAYELSGPAGRAIGNTDARPAREVDLAPGKGTTTPPGLANLPELPPPPAKAPRAKATPRTRATTTSRTAKCGQPGGAAAHRRRKEKACDACREQETASRRDRQGGSSGPRRVATCGEYGGAQAHRRRGEKLCDPCQEASRKYLADYRAQRRQAS